MAADTAMEIIAYSSIRSSLTAAQEALSAARRGEKSAEIDWQKQLEESRRYANIVQFAAQLRLLLHVAQYLTFAYFLLELARALGASGIVGNCLNLIKLSLALVLLQFLNEACLGVGMKLTFSVLRFAPALGTVMTLLAMAQSGWFLLVLHQMRELVQDQVGRRARHKKPA
jgi:hypothetical protein